MILQSSTYRGSDLFAILAELRAAVPTLREAIRHDLATETCGVICIPHPTGASDDKTQRVGTFRLREQYEAGAYDPG